MTSPMLNKIINLTQEKLSKDQEKSIIELSYKIQNKMLLPEDVEAILLSEANKNSVYGQYLLACLYLFGTNVPKINVDLNKALRLTEDLIANHSSTYALNLHHLIINEMEKSFFNDTPILPFNKLHDELCNSSNHLPITVDSSVLYKKEGVEIINARKLKIFKDLDYLQTIILHVKEQLNRNNNILKDAKFVYNNISQLIVNSEQEFKGDLYNQQVRGDNLEKNLGLLQKLLDMYSQLSTVYVITEANQRTEIIKSIQNIIDQKGIKNSEQLADINKLNNEFGKIIKALDHNLNAFNLNTFEELDKAENMYRIYRQEADKILEAKSKTIKFLNESVEKGNPIALLNVLNVIISKLEELDGQSKLEYFFEIKDYIKLIATAYVKLKDTGYYSQLTEGIKALHATLNNLSETKYSDRKNYGQFFQSDILLSREIAECWKALYDFYRVIENNTMKFYSIQMALKLDSTYKPEWLRAVGGANMSFKDITNYFSSFIQAVNVVEKKITQVDKIDAVQNIELNLDVLFNNCQFLYDHFFPEFAKDHEKQEVLKELFSKCKHANQNAKDIFNTKVTELNQSPMLGSKDTNLYR